MSLDPRATLLLTTAVAAFVLLPSFAAGELDVGRIGWSELSLTASKLGFSIESRLEIRRLSEAELERALVEPAPGEWLPAPYGGGWLLQLNTEGLGKRSRLDLLLDPRGASLQRTQLETGKRLKDHHIRTHRFGRNEIHIETFKPTREQMDKPPADWTEHSVWVQKLPAELDGNALGQATGIFLTLGAADLSEPGDRVTSHVLSKGKVMEVEMIVEGRESVGVDFVEVDASTRRRREETLDTLRIRLAGRGLGSDAEESDFRFLGMRGEVRIHLDGDTRAPVLISGRVGWMGRARARLERLVLGRH